MIPSYYYNKAITSQINQLIRCGYESYDSLDELDKELLAATCMTVLGPDARDALTESDEFDAAITHLIHYMKTADYDSSLSLVETLSKNASNYFSNNLSELFSEIFEDRVVGMYIEAGLKQHKHADNGETTWI